MQRDRVKLERAEEELKHANEKIQRDRVKLERAEEELKRAGGKIDSVQGDKTEEKGHKKSKTKKKLKRAEEEVATLRKGNELLKSELQG